ncbi:MAG TPA: phage holin family protein [Streptosporangiaceae bacterium]|nr:phage holin family protein [Streptosporangiaceae bacterium]
MAGPGAYGQTDAQPGQAQSGQAQSGQAQQAGTKQQSLGDLVALAVGDITQLVKFEVDLAKLELKQDARRLGVGAVLLGVAAFVGCLVLMLLCFAFAYGLMALGIWGWASFLIVAGTCVLLATLAVGIGMLKFRKLSGLRKTRSTVTDDLALMRRDESTTSPGTAEIR